MLLTAMHERDGRLHPYGPVLRQVDSRRSRVVDQTVARFLDQQVTSWLRSAWTRTRRSGQPPRQREHGEERDDRQ
jgi:hypothetical protein